MGKKQFALLLLVLLRKQVTTRDAQTLLGEGAYKTIQAALNKLVAHGYLEAHKRGERLHYVLTTLGRNAIEGFKRTLCPHCGLNQEMIRELYK